jgi:hypothetical protein
MPNALRRKNPTRTKAGAEDEPGARLGRYVFDDPTTLEHRSRFAPRRD